MTSSPLPVRPERAAPNAFRDLIRYEKPCLRTAAGQLLDTLLPYAALWLVAGWLLRSGVSYGFVLPLAMIAGGLLVRVFIFFHDCCHGSFFASRRANRLVGTLLGILVFTSYENWRHPHSKHHATAGDKDRRGVGDVWTMTVAEFQAATPRVKMLYQLYRNPFVLLLLGPMFIFLIGNRFPHRNVGKAERLGVVYTNLGIATIATVVSLLIGFQNYCLIQLPVILTAATIGVWMFYVQHQFEGAYWAEHERWDPVTAALQGSSYYKLPRLFQWFTGNIGLHHIHHLRPRIPNYNLQRCYDEIPAMRAVTPLTFWRSLRSLQMNLWDEKAEKLISFAAVRRLPQND